MDALASIPMDPHRTLMAYPAVADEPKDTSRAARRVPQDPLRRMTQEERKQFLKLARDRFDQEQTATKRQREREREDLKFYAGDQWPEDIRNLRKRQAAANGLPPVPARPCLTINNTRKPVRQ